MKLRLVALTKQNIKELGQTAYDLEMALHKYQHELQPFHNCHDQSYSEWYDDVLDAIKGDKSEYYLIQLGLDTIGMMDLYTGNREQLRISLFYIDPEYRGQGYGLSILKQLIKSARSKYRGINLGVLSNDDNAIKLYRRLGFEVISHNMLLPL